MPAFAADSAWPPKAAVGVYADMAEADAWYTGDKGELAKFYGQTSQRERHPERLWTQTRAFTERERRLHIPLAGDIASTSADLLFSEPPTFTVEDTKTQDRLNTLIDEGGVHMRLLEAAEQAAALGDAYLALAWDRDVIPDRPILVAWPGDAAIPTFRWGRLTEVVFWREISREGERVVRFLERHAVEQGKGVIEYTVHVGTSAILGELAPLADYDDTKPYAELDGGRQETGIGLLTATHIPNMRPNRKHRNAHGRSDYAGIYDLFDGLDATWTSWLRDIRLARARLIVPQGYLESLGPGQGAVVDLEREIWTELNMDPSHSQGITMNQFAIRVAEHEASAARFTERAVSSAGYSPATFGLDLQGGGQTATEVVHRQRRSMTTRARKAEYWAPALRRILEAMLALDAVQFSSGIAVEVPTVEFGDVVAPDPEATARTLQLLEAAGAISTYLKVATLHPDWDGEQIDEEVTRIRDDGATLVATPDLDDDGPPAGDDKQDPADADTPTEDDPATDAEA
ncbi:MAG: phage portal protein [Glycomyces artemisiae]|uniref:Phage portal protein n=1 Tax=Glycomyces artemisiae TaxID=1076443 RepID=A0A850C7S7_9ACTN|nr:phage portal protein [Glycomyces artemisiae]